MSGRHGHSHDLRGVSDGRLVWAVGLNLLLTVVEAALGVLSGSLALLADALHNFNDCAALLIALVARRVARRRADRRFTFGYRRAELIGAMINLTALIMLGLYLVYEAATRLWQPEPVEGGMVVAAAGLALAVDAATAALLWGMAQGSLNVRAAFVHNMADAAASVAVLLGGTVILLWGWTAIDPILTLAIAGYMLWQGAAMLRGAAAILMEAAPAGVDVGQVASDLRAVDGVRDVHHVHVWELDEQHRAMEAHVAVDPAGPAELEALKRRLKERLASRHGIAHATLELEFVAAGETRGHDESLIARH